MRKHYGMVRRVMACFLVAVLLCLSIPTLASPADLVVRLLGQGSAPLQMTISEPEVRTLAQFDEKRLSMLNALIRHLSVTFTLDGSKSETKVSVDRETAFSVLSDGETKIYSFAPETVVEGETEASVSSTSLPAFIGEEFSLYMSLPEVLLPFFEELPSAFEGRMKSEKKELWFSGYGKSARRDFMTISAEETEAAKQAFLPRTASEQVRNWLSDLRFEGNQKVGLLYDAEGALLRVTWEGRAGRGESLRRVSLNWRILRAEGLEKDKLSLKTPAVSGNDRDNLELERVFDRAEAEKQTVKLNLQLEQKAGKDPRSVIRFAADLSGNAEELSGKITWEKKQGSSQENVNITPHLQEEAGGHCTGSLEIMKSLDKSERERFLMKVGFQEGETLSWPATEGFSVLQAGEGEERIRKGIARSLLRSLLNLPESDLVYLGSGLPEEEWKKILQITGIQE